MFNYEKTPSQDGEQGDGNNGDPNRKSCGNSQRCDILIAPENCHPKKSFGWKAKIFENISPGNVWQPGVPLEDSVEESRDGNQEGGEQDKGKEGAIFVDHLF